MTLISSAKPSTLTASHIIVVGNEKGGCGKTTISMHIAAHLMHEGYHVATIDIDARQRSLTRYVENRRNYIVEQNLNVPFPTHFVVNRSKFETKQEIEEDEHTRFEECLKRAVGAHFIVIDAPGSDTPLSRHAHSFADTIITPINDSFIDLDVLAKINRETYRVDAPGVYSEMVWEAKKKRAERCNKSIDWIVLRNRLTTIDAHNKRAMAAALKNFSSRLGCRLAHGLSERVIFRELFLKGLTLLDVLGIEKQIDVKVNMGHVAARQELRDFIDYVNLPKHLHVLQSDMVMESISPSTPRTKAAMQTEESSSPAQSGTNEEVRVTETAVVIPSMKESSSASVHLAAPPLPVPPLPVPPLSPRPAEDVQNALEAMRQKLTQTLEETHSVAETQAEPAFSLAESFAEPEKEKTSWEEKNSEEISGHTEPAPEVAELAATQTHEPETESPVAMEIAPAAEPQQESPPTITPEPTIETLPQNNQNPQPEAPVFAPIPEEEARWQLPPQETFATAFWEEAAAPTEAPVLPSVEAQAPIPPAPSPESFFAASNTVNMPVTEEEQAAWLEQNTASQPQPEEPYYPTQYPPQPYGQMPPQPQPYYDPNAAYATQPYPPQPVAQNPYAPQQATPYPPQQATQYPQGYDPYAYAAAAGQIPPVAPAPQTGQAAASYYPNWPQQNNNG